jgi:hypothetical protein
VTESESTVTLCLKSNFWGHYTLLAGLHQLLFISFACGDLTDPSQLYATSTGTLLPLPSQNVPIIF